MYSSDFNAAPEHSLNFDRSETKVGENKSDTLEHFPEASSILVDKSLKALKEIIVKEIHTYACYIF